MNDQIRSAQPFRVDWDISAVFPAIRMVLQIDFDTLELLDKAHDGFIGQRKSQMNKLQLLKLTLGIVLLAPFPVFADGHEEPTPVYANVPAPPDLPDPVESGEVLEPEITIHPGKDGGTITEYSVNGNVYKVKITPAFGPPYYLIDKNGDGKMDCKTNNIYDDICVSEWVLFSW